MAGIGLLDCVLTMRRVADARSTILRSASGDRSEDDVDTCRICVK